MLGHNSRIEIIRAAQEAAQDGIDAWRQNMVIVAVQFAEARAEHPSNGAFGAWLATSGLETYNDHDRAALIRIGQAGKKVAKIVFEDTDRQSPQMIVREGELQAVLDRIAERQRRLGSTTKTDPEPETIPDSPDMEADAPENVEPEDQEEENSAPEIDMKGKRGLSVALLGADGAAPLYAVLDNRGTLPKLHGHVRSYADGNAGQKSKARSFLKRIADNCANGSISANNLTNVTGDFQRLLYPNIPTPFFGNQKITDALSGKLYNMRDRLAELDALCAADDSGNLYQKAHTWWTHGTWGSPAPVLAVNNVPAELQPGEEEVVMYGTTIYPPSQHDVDFGLPVPSYADAREVAYICEEIVSDLMSKGASASHTAKLIRFYSKRIAKLQDVTTAAALMQRVAAALDKTTTEPERLQANKIPHRDVQFAKGG